jgi:hypothetical protein
MEEKESSATIGPSNESGKSNRISFIDFGVGKIGREQFFYGS